MLADTAIAGRSSYVVLQVRRPMCSNTGCDRRTFVEQIDGLTKAYARTTPLLRGTLEKIAFGICAGHICRTLYPVAPGPSAT
nr:hypothetical protein [Rhodococcus sp. 008]